MGAYKNQAILDGMFDHTEVDTSQPTPEEFNDTMRSALFIAGAMEPRFRETPEYQRAVEMLTNNRKEM